MIYSRTGNPAGGHTIPGSIFISNMPPKGYVTFSAVCSEVQTLTKSSKINKADSKSSTGIPGNSCLSSIKPLRIWSSVSSGRGFLPTLKLVSVEFFQNIPSHFDFLFVAITCRRPEPTVTNLHNIADEMFENGVMDFIPDCFVCFQIFVELFEAAPSSCGNQLSKQGRAKLRWASALIGKPREPEDKDGSFECVQILDASVF